MTTSEADDITVTADERREGRSVVSVVHGNFTTSLRVSDGELRRIRDAINAHLSSPPADDTEVEWEYGVRHVALDGWPTERAHFSLAEAREDLDSCGINCHLIRRNIARETGKWEPLDGEARL